MRLKDVLLIILALAGWASAQPVADRDFHDDGKPAAAKVELGRMLFFDKILSGNKNISCATCHHPRHATADAVALGFGEGARGLGPKRRPGRSHREKDRWPRF